VGRLPEAVHSARRRYAAKIAFKKMFPDKAGQGFEELIRAANSFQEFTTGRFRHFELIDPIESLTLLR
jgi:hypothetical protein